MGNDIETGSIQITELPSLVAKQTALTLREKPVPMSLPINDLPWLQTNMPMNQFGSKHL